ncbi:MAG TPA: DUF2461 domain-containing protein [Cyclobacteriaceae bacterium]
MDFSRILKFLKAIAKNNDREWFEKNKAAYLESKQLFEDFAEDLLTELGKFDKDLIGLNPKKLPFRIYRDVRFSKDKRPYKVNMGAGISPGGKMIQEPGYYIHIEPGNNSFIAGGFYQPDATNLAKIRQEIDYNFKSFEKVMKGQKFKSYYKGLGDFDKLKTAPKGYPKDHPHVDILKHKSFIVSHNFSDKEVIDKNFLKKVVEGCKQVKPLNDFLRHAIA